MATDAELNTAIQTAGAFIGGGLALAGGAIGAGIGDGLAGSSALAAARGAIELPGGSGGARPRAPRGALLGGPAGRR